MKESVRKAAKKYQQFTGKRATETRVMNVPDVPETVVLLGKLQSVSYVVEKEGDGEQVEYVHRFRRKPALLTDADGRHLYIAGGSIRVTDRGIEG